jgi:peroxiredoxin
MDDPTTAFTVQRMPQRRQTRTVGFAVYGRRQVMVSRRAVLGSGVAATAAAIAGYLAWSARTESDQGSSGPELGTEEFFPSEQRQTAPGVTGELLDGAPFNLSDWRGQVVVFNWWGSWCAPCRAEAEDLRAVYEATHELGVEFLGVNVRDGRDAATAFVDAFGHTWPSLFDPGGEVALDFRDVPPTVIPTTLLLDRQHRIAAVFRRRVYQPELEDTVRELAGEEQA